jgi:hypothetical protein
MHNELHQFTRNDIWTLVPLPAEHNIIGTKWIFKNKTDEHGTVVRNKARLVAQGYTQIEGIGHLLQPTTLTVSTHMNHVHIALILIIVLVVVHPGNNSAICLMSK